MANPHGSLAPQISKAFLRGLEADLRGLCADARKRNPDVKEKAEHVILILKEADDQDSETNAADEAAAVFCSACESSDITAGSTSVSTQVKVVLRAVSSLHKLLIHRAVYPSRLPEILGALERLSDPCVDDNVTVKVLQGILSILTIRGYAKSLSQDEILRAFTLLFTVRTSQPLSPHASSAAFAAVTAGSSGNVIGVIEQTAKAAFRQVTSDLFASASDAAVQTAVDRMAPSSEFIAVALFPVEVRAAFSLFLDLINAASGDPLEWIPSSSASMRPTGTLLDVQLAVEVLDDNLASNIALFAGQPVFSEVLSARLCPVIHRLLKTVNERHTLRSLLSLIVSLIRHYWGSFQPDTEALLHGLSKMSLERAPIERKDGQWIPVYAIEALRCIFRQGGNESNRVLDFVKAFDLRDGSDLCIGQAVRAVCHLMNRWKIGMIEHVPDAALTNELKPFPNIIKPTDDFRAAVATSLYVQIVDSTWEAVKLNDTATARALMSATKLELCTSAVERMTDDILSHGLASLSGGTKGGPKAAYNILTRSMGVTAKICDACTLVAKKDLVLESLSNICSKSVAQDVLDESHRLYQVQAVNVAYDVLLDVAVHCRESLGRSWLPILRAMERLENYVCSNEKLLKTQVLHESNAFDVLNLKVQSILNLPAQLSWKASHDMIAAFVQCSRLSVTHASKNEDAEDLAKARIGPDLPIFGMKCAESAFRDAIHRDPEYKGSEPSSLWQLLSSHLASVCLDSAQHSLRLLALKTLTRLVCGIVSEPRGMIPQNVVVAPFLDLLASSHTDVSTGCIHSVHLLLTTQGEQLSNAAAWFTILQILSIAGGTTLPKFSIDSFKGGSSTPETILETLQGPELVSEGFKGVQVIASDFLASLSKESLLSWIALSRVYCLQNQDINVALTAIGLLWRTADFLARSSSETLDEPTWIALVVALKDISSDERPEVRKCAIKTLMGALSTHASKISSEVWSVCLRTALIPLLQNVLLGGATSSLEEPAPSKFSSEVPLLLHHSRDTPRKQWNETRVLALGGVAEVLRLSLPYMIRDSNGFEAKEGNPSKATSASCWNELLRIQYAAACNRDTEVAVAGVSAILDCMHSFGRSCKDSASDPSNWISSDKAISAFQPSAGAATEKLKPDGHRASDEHLMRNLEETRPPRQGHLIPLPEVLWESTWKILADLFEHENLQTSDQTQRDDDERRRNLADHKAVSLLAEGLINVWRKLRTKFSPKSSEVLAAILIKLSFASSSNIQLEFHSLDELSQLEEIAVAGLKEVAVTGDAACRYSIICEVLSSLHAPSEPSFVSSQKQVTRTIQMITLVYEHEETPIAMKLDLLPRVIQALRLFIVSHESRVNIAEGRISRKTDFPAAESEENEVWTAALDVLISVMRSVPEDHFRVIHASLWIPFLSVIEEFAYPMTCADNQNTPRIGENDDSRSKKRERYAILLVQSATKALTHAPSDSCSEAKQYLLKLLTRGAGEGVSSGRPRFVHACQKILFSLANNDNHMKPSPVSSEAAEFVVHMCDRALHAFVADDQRAGRCPLPAKRREEIVFLLTQLILLNHKSSASRKHIVALYPRLCECVESRDEALKSLARELLDEAAPSKGDLESRNTIERPRAEVA